MKLSSHHTLLKGIKSVFKESRCCAITTVAFYALILLRQNSCYLTLYARLMDIDLIAIIILFLLV